MAVTPEALWATPNALAPHYTRFRVTQRLLLTGHSHQAWPDVGFEGQQQAWLDAAALVDDKWDEAFRQADRVRAGFRGLLDDPQGDIALGPNTHDLIVRLLSALPLRRRPRLVTSDGEFHTIRRQLDRLAEEGLEVIRVASEPAGTLAERLAGVVDDRTASVFVSAVLYESGHIVPNLGDLLVSCQQFGVELLVDAYHALNVVPFSLREQRLEAAYVTGGGYKYCQLGEGNCFLRIPRDCQLRPVITGWFSEFGTLATAPSASRVPYGAGPLRFAGATYDPTSHYRAAAVWDFFTSAQLTPTLLREVSQHQVALLVRRFDELELDPHVVRREGTVPLSQIGGFLALRAPHADDLCRRLRARGVWTDARGDALRLGPAPYLSDRQLEDAVAVLGEVARTR